MKKNLLNSLLVTLMVLVGGSAWAGDKTVVKYSFDDATSPELTAGSRVSFDYDKTSVITSTKFLNAWNNANGDPGASTLSLGNTDLSGETWTLSFEWAAVGGCNSKPDHTTLKAGDTNLFDISGNSNWNATVTLSYTGSDGTKTLPVPGCNKSYRFTAAVGNQMNTTDYWHHFVITGSDNGVKMTITNSSTGTVVVEDIVLSETNVNPTSLILEPCCGGGIGIDELSLTYYVEGEVIQTPIAAYTAVNGIERTITATCETEGATIQYSTDGTNWTDGASITVSVSGNVYFKAVKGTSESDVVSFAVVAGEAITLNAPAIVRSDNTTVTITADQANLLLSPTATITYEYGNEKDSFTGSKTLTVAADATITAYAEATGYTTSATSELAVALFPIYVNQTENTPAATKGWSANAFSEDTKTVSERTYAALLLDDAQWGSNIYLQTDGAWGLRANGNWYINSDTQESWILMPSMKKGDIIVVDASYPASSTVNATYSKYAYGTKFAYEVTDDGDVELALKKINAATMDYLYGVYAYTAMSEAEIALIEAKTAFMEDITAAKAIDTTDMNGAAELAAAITAAEAAIAAADATVESIAAAKTALAAAVAAFNKANFDIATAIANADFSADEPIAQKICTYAKDVQEGQVANMQPLTGWTIVENGDARAAGVFAYGSAAILGGDGGNVPAVGPNGEAEGKVLGLEAVWSATTQYTQEVKLPAGEYLFEAVVYNAAGTGALSQNLIGIDGTYCTTKSYPVGKWTKDQVKITLAEEKTVTVSLGVNSGNVGNGSAPHLFIDHVKLYGSEEIAAIELAAAKENASAEVNALPTGDALFLYPVDAVNTAKAAIETAATVDDINAAVATAKAAQNKPAADKAYKITNTTATGNLCIAEGKISVAQGATVKFTAVEGGYVLSKDSLYVFKTTDNNWTLSTTKNIAEAYVLTFNPVEGGYTIKGAKGLFGLDSTDEGSTVYANKAQSNNGLWTIAEYVAPEPVKTDYTEYIVNADLTAAEIGWNAEGTKTSDYKEGAGIVKVGSAAAFDFKQTIENLPAGKYKVTAQAAYRYGGDEQAEYDAMQTDAITKLVQLYATVGTKTVAQPVQNRYDGASETDYANGNGSVTVNEKFVPNSSSAIQAWFAAGQYVNEVIFNLPADGAVTIGINRTGTPESDYTVIGPWTLTRLGDAEVEPEPEPEPQPGQDMTKYITNPSFETGNTNGWTYETSNDHGAKRNDNGTYTMTNCDGDYLFNIWSSGNAISQKVENLPNGTYLMKAVIATDANQQVQLNANGKSIKIDAVGKETGVEGELEFDVLNNTATIGAEGVNKYWYKVDNFRLTYVKGFDIAALKDIYKTALAEAQAITGNMSAEAKLALTAAIAVEVDTTDASSLITAANTLTEAAATANASVAAYAKAKAAIDAAKAEMAATNVYTAEALEAYKAVYDAAEPKYENGTMTDEEAKALENPTTITGWHDATIVDNFLLSAWDTNPDFQDAPYYINTWSTEGNNDGSNFKVPFFEYWTSDANSLGTKTLTATMNSLPAGDYDISAWVRVRIKNGAEAPATGITLQANEGEAINVAAGDQIGTSQFYLKEFTATGTVAEDGVLKIKFNVAADNNISWLSFKNVKFEKKPFKPEAIEGALYSWESPEGLPGEYGGKISYVNGVDNRLNYQNAGYYTICLNGKKANMNDTIAKADASYMLVTLDEALSEGDTIYITAYVNKNASKKASAYILFDNGADVESPVYSDEANIDTLFNGVPTTKSIIVTEAMAGAKSFKMTRGQTGTNLFITKFVIMKKKSEPVEPAKYEYNGYVTIARIAQNNVLGDVTSETQKVTITETEDKAIVAVTFSGFETFPEFTFNANVTGGDSVTYTVAEGSKVNVQQGQMAIEYNLTGNGTQASTEAIPTIALQMFQNPAMTINVVFAATAEEAKAALLKTTGIINIARDGQKSVIYNINGQKVNKAQKGLFIINGKKTVVK